MKKGNTEQPTTMKLFVSGGRGSCFVAGLWHIHLLFNIFQDHIRFTLFAHLVQEAGEEFGGVV